MAKIKTQRLVTTPSAERVQISDHTKGGEGTEKGSLVLVGVGQYSLTGKQCQSNRYLNCGAPGHLSLRNENLPSHKNLCMNVCSTSQTWDDPQTLWWVHV